ncbi:MAG: hypothetical protein LBO62_03740 [Endomicrobium sp.]|jgi:cell division protein FtsL|nr:hypothetical protein [Endomicrobium sp.]
MSRLLIAAVFAVCCCFIYVWQQNGAVRMGLAVSALQNEYDKINAENDALRVKITSILSLDKMDKIAKEKRLYKPSEKETERID